jgi:hypothetical protein
VRQIPLEVLQYPLIEAIARRRTRRVARGVSIAAGPLSHTSTNAPAPLDPLEEAILIVATGLTGVVTHDGPLDMPDGGKELGTPFLHVMGRAASSPDNIQAVRMIMINDAGTWLIERLPPAKTIEMLGALPPRWSEWSGDDWLAVAKAVKTRIGNRLEFPRRFPFYLGWNKQLSNVPGTTMFLPIVDCTRGYITALLNLAMEPDGQRPLFMDDWRCFHPKTPFDFVASAASKLGMVQLPYQLVGGVKHVRSKYVNPALAAPLGMFRTFLADHEAHFHLQNLMLLTQAMGLGGWVHFCPPSPFLFEGDGTPECKGLGFRMEKPKKKKWFGDPPPPPSWLPNPVGIPGVLEANTPPFVKDMDEAVDNVLEAKFGKGGAYDAALLARGYADSKSAAEYLKRADRYDERAVAYVKEICNYIYNTYGRFPAHVDAFYVPGTWLQVSHPELEYYERTVPPEMIARQKEHARIWQEGDASR